MRFGQSNDRSCWTIGRVFASSHHPFSWPAVGNKYTVCGKLSGWGQIQDAVIHGRWRPKRWSIVRRQRFIVFICRGRWCARQIFACRRVTRTRGGPTALPLPRQHQGFCYAKSRLGISSLLSAVDAARHTRSILRRRLHPFGSSRHHRLWRRARCQGRRSSEIDCISRPLARHGQTLFESHPQVFYLCCCSFLTPVSWQ